MGKGLKIGLVGVAFLLAISPLSSASQLEKKTPPETPADLIIQQWNPDLKDISLMSSETNKENNEGDTWEESGKGKTLGSVEKIYTSHTDMKYFEKERAPFMQSMPWTTERDFDEISSPARIFDASVRVYSNRVENQNEFGYDPYFWGSEKLKETTLLKSLMILLEVRKKF